MLDRWCIFDAFWRSDLSIPQTLYRFNPYIRRNIISVPHLDSYCPRIPDPTKETSSRKCQKVLPWQNSCVHQDNRLWISTEFLNNSRLTCKPTKILQNVHIARPWSTITDKPQDLKPLRWIRPPSSSHKATVTSCPWDCPPHSSSDLKTKVKTKNKWWQESTYQGGEGRGWRWWWR